MVFSQNYCTIEEGQVIGTKKNGDTDISKYGVDLVYKIERKDLNQKLISPNAAMT